MEVTADDSDNYTNILTKLFLGEMAFKGELNQVVFDKLNNLLTRGMFGVSPYLYQSTPDNTP